MNCTAIWYDDDDYSDNYGCGNYDGDVNDHYTDNGDDHDGPSLIVLIMVVLAMIHVGWNMR